MFTCYLATLSPYAPPNTPPNPQVILYRVGTVSPNLTLLVPNLHSRLSIYRDWCV